MSFSDIKTQITDSRAISVDLAVDGGSVIDVLNDIALQLDALYVQLGTLGMRQHCPEVASISQRLQVLRDNVQAVLPPVVPSETPGVEVVKEP